MARAGGEGRATAEVLWAVVIWNDSYALAMPKARTHYYFIEIKNAKGVGLFSGKAYWTEKEKRVALGQIMRLAEMPEVNCYAQPMLEPHSKKAPPRRRSECFDG
jgi:hypothetical protein